MSHSHAHITDSKKLGLTILLNVVITTAEFIGGILSGSLALLSDAAHNLSDVIALILAYFGARGAELKPTKRSTYGFKRLEVLTALINALTLVGIAGYIIYEAFERYSDPQEIDAPIMLTVAVIGLLGNLASVFILHKNRNMTINNRAAFLHMLYDTISSVAVIIGGVIIFFSGWLLLDLILSVLIAMMIFWSGLDIIKEAGGIFMEAVPKNINIDEVTQTIADIDGIEDVHHLHIWSISSSQPALSCHIKLAADRFGHCTDIIKTVHQTLLEKHGIDHVTIQPETDFCPEQVVHDIHKNRRSEA